MFMLKVKKYHSTTLCSRYFVILVDEEKGLVMKRKISAQILHGPFHGSSAY